MKERYTARRQQLHSEGVTAQGNFRLAYVRPAPALEKQGVVAVLESCLDASAVTVYKAGKSLGPGKAAHDTSFFSRSDGALKLYDQISEAVASC